MQIFHPLAKEVAKGYGNATVRPSFRPFFGASFRNILVNTLESTSFKLPTFFDVFGCNTGYPVYIIVILL
jgi:hypothetical protein